MNYNNLRLNAMIQGGGNGNQIIAVKCLTPTISRRIARWP